MKIVLVSVSLAVSISLGSAQSRGAFTRVGDLTVPRVGHSATLLPTGKVLVTGGASSIYSLGSVWASAELYDPATGNFRLTGTMSTPRMDHTATLLSDGTVLIAGGRSAHEPNNATAVATAEIYDPTTGTFTPVGQMTVPRVWHSAVLLANGQVLITGGMGTWSGGIDTRWNVTEIYDPGTRTFRQTGSMRFERFVHTATLLPDGQVLVAGGEGRDDGPITFVERYNPATGTFQLAGSSGSVETVGPAVVSLLPNGQVLMNLQTYGGGSGTGAELYDPRSETFATTGSLRAPQYRYSSTLLPTGEVLLVGRGTAPDFPGAELYDPATGTFALTGEVVIPRFLHTATLLTDGTVLVSGGMALPQSGAIASAEIYRPEVLTPAPTLYTLPESTNQSGAVLHAATHEVVTASHPAVAGEALEVYGTGLLEDSVIPPQIAIGGRAVEMMYFGPAPGYPGLDQMNVRVPFGLSPSESVPLRLRYLERSSNQVSIALH